MQSKTYPLNMTLVACREGVCMSRYFNFQKAYRYFALLADGLTVETSAYLHYQSMKPWALAIDVSCMVGCPVGCKFCAAATVSYQRLLNPEEMNAQFEQLFYHYNEPAFPKMICSFQGIGEPSLMPLDVLKTSEKALSLDSRVAVSISTTLANENAISIWCSSGLPIDNLQFSCSATSFEQAHRLLPGGLNPENIVQVAAKAANFSNVKKVKLNYILLHGINDSLEDANRLIKMVSPYNLIVKISILNATDSASEHGFRPARIIEASAFAAQLHDAGIDCYVYGNLTDTNVGCGQLLSKKSGGQSNAI